MVGKLTQEHAKGPGGRSPPGSRGEKSRDWAESGRDFRSD
ncbi:hypothetical protein COLO4_17182 [Corchorus olitorius]|uniref:Uncharacterized protein n=1 Tax=Corchorus olitorius TaxID=93759 RepID=A0A1R3JDT6_9ROSI|nr:hypothetical protein COLO4_17182 [Corchorus olitorius]